MCLYVSSAFSGSVLSVAVSLNGELCFSGSADSSIGVWQLPGDLSDPFDVYGKNSFCLLHLCLCKTITSANVEVIISFLYYAPMVSNSCLISLSPTDPQLNMGELKGHTDAIWDLAVHPTSGFLLSCASDGSCRLWNHQLTNPQIKLYQAEESKC